MGTSGIGSTSMTKGKDEMMTESCKNCKFFGTDKENATVCRKGHMWLFCDSDEWCGEWKPAKNNPYAEI